MLANMESRFAFGPTPMSGPVLPDAYESLNGMPKPPTAMAVPPRRGDTPTADTGRGEKPPKDEAVVGTRATAQARAPSASTTGMHSEGGQMWPQAQHQVHAPWANAAKNGEWNCSAHIPLKSNGVPVVFSVTA